MVKKKFSMKWIIIVALLVIGGGTYAYISSIKIPVDMAIVERGQVVKLIKETGTVESGSTVIVTAKDIGNITKIMVAEGDAVYAGATLMTTREDVTNTATDTKKALDIKSMKSELSGLQAQYDQAKGLAAKNKILYEQGALSYEQYNDSATASKRILAQINALNYSIKSYGVSTTEISRVAAPKAGVITSVYVEEGERAVPGMQLFEISDLRDRFITVDFMAEDVDLMEVGDSARAYNEGEFYDDSCKVKKIYAKAQEKISDLGVNQKRVTVEIAFGTTAAVRLGSDIDVEVLVDERNKVLRISDKAIFEMNKKDYVYVVENGTAVSQKVVKGLEGENFTEILSGLEEGDRVIISPNDKIEDGVKVKEE